jgi:NADPH:quinone reductase-like Zn-dependent oxidoreductase
LVVKFLQLAYGEFGEIGDVLRVEEAEIVDALADDEVLLKLLASPVHPSDLGMISGKYGDLPKLPAIGGREGVGEIVDAGATCANLIGKVVRMPFGAWRTLAVEKAGNLFFVPDGLDTYQAAMAFINPLTAWMLLNTIRPLRAGDWVIQNAANSAVGIAAIQIAGKMGLRTVNLLRDAEGRRRGLIAHGATLIFEDETFDPKILPDHTGGVLPSLGLNSVGGNSAMNVIKSMAFGGEVVTFGGMVGDRVRFPTRELIFNDLRLRGFWLDKWSKSQSHGAMASMYGKIFNLIASGVVDIPVDSTVKLSGAVKMLPSAIKNRKDGKILIIP